MESTDIIAALRKSGGNIAPAAALLNVTRACVYARIKGDPEIAAAVEDIRGAAQPKGDVGAAVAGLEITPRAYTTRARADGVTDRAAAYKIAVERVAATTRRSKAEVLLLLRDPAVAQALAAKLPSVPARTVEFVVLPVQVTHAQGAWLAQQPKGTVAKLLAKGGRLPSLASIQSAAAESADRSTSFRVSEEARDRLRQEADRRGVTITAVFRAIVNAERAKPPSRKAA